MIISINGRIFPVNEDLQGAETAAFLHRLMSHSEPVPISKSATVVPIRRDKND